MSYEVHFFVSNGVEMGRGGDKEGVLSSGFLTGGGVNKVFQKKTESGLVAGGCSFRACQAFLFPTKNLLGLSCVRTGGRHLNVFCFIVLFVQMCFRDPVLSALFLSWIG